ncbi:MAG TPA: AI-2E family transporter [candidate division WOR-3 bacterium]|uniref:AI-2E family transporter n=1 Tax=candidate division WOR-3 bacterium TaxID=2052148 RepID=A0A9C9JZ92_UNCW3|nr:AI-2E family transporter [candidate division WOR-3 bacterium]
MQKVVFYITIVLIAGFIILSKTFSPIWLLLLVLTVLWPFRRDKNVRPVFLLTILLFLFYFLLHYSSILVPFIIGLGLAYILTPMVDFLERRKVPRVIAILVFLLPIVAVIPLLITLIISGLINELQVLINKIPYAIQQIQLYSGTVIDKLIELGIDVDPNIIANTITTHLSNVIAGVFKTIGQIGRGIGSIIMIIYNFVFIPLSAYLFLSDREEITEWFRNLFGLKERKKVDAFINKLNVSLARFFRGTLLLMFIVGFIVGFSLWILGIKYYLLLGVIAGLCNLIPNIGYILSFLPAILIGLTSPSPLLNLIKIASVYIGEQLLENFFLGPLIIGRSSKLHPVVVMIVLILGGMMLGFWGVILAVPAVIFIREFLNHFLGLNL